MEKYWRVYCFTTESITLILNNGHPNPCPIDSCDDYNANKDENQA